MVCKTTGKEDEHEWNPEKNAENNKREWWDTDSVTSGSQHLEQSKMRLHGSYRLKKEYCLVPVPARAAVSAPAGRTDASHYLLASSHNIPRMLISFIQALWAIVTLYRARGDQVDQFGYAAFGLTVAQYAFMSVINIIGNLLQPEYPSLFMIRTPLMNEAEKAGCYFEGEINVQIGKGKSPWKLASDQQVSYLFILLTGTFLGSMVFVIIGSLSGFKKRESTTLERGFTMSWLVISILFGPLIRLFHFNYVRQRSERSHTFPFNLHNSIWHPGNRWNGGRWAYDTKIWHMRSCGNRMNRLKFYPLLERISCEGEDSKSL
jgi:hypothetical protein